MSDEGPKQPKSPRLIRNISMRRSRASTTHLEHSEVSLRNQRSSSRKRNSLSRSTSGHIKNLIHSTNSDKPRRRKTSIPRFEDELSPDEEQPSLVTFRNILSTLTPRSEQEIRKTKLERELKASGHLLYLSKESPEEKEIRLQKATATIDELVSTEEAYLQDLDVMINKIMRPMEEKKDFLTGEPLVSKEELHKIWSNIALLPQVNEVLLQELNKIHNEEGDDRQLKVAEAFSSVADYMKIYTVFCSNQPVSSSTVQKLLKRSQFEAFLAEKADVSVMEESRNLDLNAFLIKPVQRICKYPLFMRDLLRVTPFDHPSFMPLSDAAAKIDEVVLSINESKKSAENNIRLADIAAQISKLPIPLLIPGRYIILHGEFKKLSVNNKGSVKGTVFLFSDIILFAKNGRRKKLKYISHSTVRFVNLSTQEEKDVHLLNSTGRVVFSISFEDSNVMQTWVDNIQQVVQQQHQAIKGKRLTC